jgi:hypothetical protein
MAFIEKKDPTVLNIKLTSKGRELLATGKLKFKKFVVGDSEINYDIYYRNGRTVNNINILRPKDKNHNIITYLKRDESDEKYTDLPTVVANTLTITNTAKEYGFFDGDEIILEPTHVKQADVVVRRNELSGGTIMSLHKAPTYLGNRTEPSVGDLLVVKFDNNTNVLSNLNVKPILFYKINEIISGTLEDDDLKVSVDKNTPDFSGSLSLSGVTGTTGTTGTTGATEYRVFVYPSKYEFQTDNTYSTDYVSEEVLAFITNTQPPEGEIPIWNMDIVYLYDVAGTQAKHKEVSKYSSSKYSSFITFIQNYDIKYDKLGLIHYTNQLPSNTYGEGFFYNTPIIKIPTICWHKSAEEKYGLTLKCYGSKKILSDLNLEYFDLIDEVGNVFNTLKMIVIEDQELLFAMSYKANRSWTLPKPVVGMNINEITDYCLDCTIVAEIFNDDNNIVIRNVRFNQGTVYVEIRNTENNNIVYLNEMVDLDALTVSVENGNYDVSVIDTGSGNCKITLNINIE